MHYAAVRDCRKSGLSQPDIISEHETAITAKAAAIAWAMENFTFLPEYGIYKERNYRIVGVWSKNPGAYNFMDTHRGCPEMYLEQISEGELIFEYLNSRKEKTQ